MSLALKHACTSQKATNDKLLTPDWKEGSAFLTLWTKALAN